jgi:hypothetical protein
MLRVIMPERQIVYPQRGGWSALMRIDTLRTHRADYMGIYTVLLLCF